MAAFIAVATWPFGRKAVQAAAHLLIKGQPALDAAIAGAQAIEDDPEVTSVGYGGIPNGLGTVQLDACVMDGHTLNCGAVAAVENVRHPAALARRVMEKTPYILLAGEGARVFAVQQGFPLENLNTATGLAEYDRRLARQKRPPAPGPPSGAGLANHPLSHDTVVVLALDERGFLGGACSTSGLALKLPGRVGDSPLIGQGLYVDNQAGAAGGTGVGEEVIRAGGGLLIVEAMRAGRSAPDACADAVRRLIRIAVRRGVHPPEVAFVALDRHGNPGAACTPRTDFKYAVARPGGIEMIQAPAIELGYNH